MNWVWAGKCPAWFIPSGEAHSASGILFSTRKLNSVLALQILGYETLQRPALSCTRNKRTVIAAPHNTYSLLLSAYSTSSLSVPRKPSHGLTSPLVLPAEEPGASPGHSCVLKAAGQLCPGTRQGKKYLGKAVYAFAEGFPSPFNTANLTVHANCNIPGISVGRGTRGCWMLGSIIIHSILCCSDNSCLTKSTEMLHYQHQTQRRGLLWLVINGPRKTHFGVWRSSVGDLASAKILSIQ